MIKAENDWQDGRPKVAMQYCMGVDHGGRGGQVPTEFGARGDCPPDFVMLQNFKHQITCITM